MEIDIFTIRDKKTNELIHAEGTSDYDEYCSSFKLDGKWLTDKEKNSSSWRSNYQNLYQFNGEVRHLIDREYTFIVFTLEEIEIS